MFSPSIGADNAVPAVPLDIGAPGTAQAGTLGGISLEGRTGSPRAGPGQGPALARQVFALLDGGPANLKRAALCGQDVPSRPDEFALTFDRFREAHGDLVDALLASDINFPALRKHWNGDFQRFGSTVAKYLKDDQETRAKIVSIAHSSVGDAAERSRQCMALNDVRRDAWAEIYALMGRHFQLSERHLFGTVSKALAGAHNEALWKRLINALVLLRGSPTYKALEVAISIADHGMKDWAALISKWDALVEQAGPDGLQVKVAQRDAPDIAVIPRKVALVANAIELEAAQLESSVYCRRKPLRNSALGTQASMRAAPLLHATQVITDTSTARTWYWKMSLDRDRPWHMSVNSFSENLMRLEGNYRQQNTSTYSKRDVVLYQLLSCSRLDPARITMIELVRVDPDLIQWLGRQASARQGSGIGDDIPWQDVPVDLFLKQTEQGRLVGEIAEALGKEVRHAWCFDYLPYESGRPAPEGQAATVSADDVWTDVLTFIAPPLVRSGRESHPRTVKRRRVGSAR